MDDLVMQYLFACTTVVRMSPVAVGYFDGVLCSAGVVISRIMLAYWLKGEFTLVCLCGDYTCQEAGNVFILLRLGHVAKKFIS